MIEHKCNKEEFLKDVKKDLYGNGKQGLKYDMAALKVTSKIILGLQIIILAAMVVSMVT